MQTAKIDLLETYLSLYINHFEVLNHMDTKDSPYVILDVRNAPSAVKKDQIKGALAIPAKDLPSKVNELNKEKTYVAYDWTSGTILGKQALLILLKAGFKAYELGGALEGWKGMKLPIETLNE
ncbi:rhodanese-like domain-containing protein [Enterococcus alishanensis]|uniref:Rhodanese-like domain-containing protein n=1 Tax=Enterococcus alishanensis TaxID=1303817 RepID=A0ABS6TH75_9ENTE|nr:rhodanese-like domain-containing protein [Enterococcus alishanensis]MBV7392243.1 rhodanese-like domain-containing protein [Enterococcus alishanensis]